MAYALRFGNSPSVFMTVTAVIGLIMVRPSLSLFYYCKVLASSHE